MVFIQKHTFHVIRLLSSATSATPTGRCDGRMLKGFKGLDCNLRPDSGRGVHCELLSGSRQDYGSALSKSDSGLDLHFQTFTGSLESGRTACASGWQELTIWRRPFALELHPHFKGDGFDSQDSRVECV